MCDIFKLPIKSARGTSPVTAGNLPKGKVPKLERWVLHFQNGQSCRDDGVAFFALFIWNSKRTKEQLL